MYFLQKQTAIHRSPCNKSARHPRGMKVLQSTVLSSYKWVQNQRNRILFFLPSFLLLMICKTLRESQFPVLYFHFSENNLNSVDYRFQYCSNL